MEPNETNAALNQMVSQLQGGVLRVGIASAIPIIAGWERTLEATGLPELAPIAENLRALRTTLSSEDSDPAEVGAAPQPARRPDQGDGGKPIRSAHRGPPGATEPAIERGGGAIAGRGTN